MPVDGLGALALALSVILIAAKLGGDLATRTGQPAVLGELLAGVLLSNAPGIGPLHTLAAVPHIDILAQLGMLLLLFEVGLALSVRDLVDVGGSSLLVALFGTVASFTLGTAVAAALLPTAARAVHVFLGAAVTATSVALTARVLKDLGASRGREARIVLGAAVVDDVLALVLLAVVTGWLGSGARGEAFRGWPVFVLAAKTIGFLGVALWLGTRLAPAGFRQAARLRTPGALLAGGLGFCFFLSWAASAIGLAPLIGAFAAGLVLEDVHSEVFVQRGERSLGEMLDSMTAFLVPVFFVVVGLRVNLASVITPGALGLAAALTLAAVAGKLACAAGVVSRGASRLTVAAAMIPRGEVTLVYAALGLTLHAGDSPILDARSYAALVAVVLMTTLLTPPALRWSLARAGVR
jgi:Kef-type K+ transport system membrane component KefB